MTNYVKSTNFASKDSLAIGNPLKIVKGTEIDTEFNNISTAVATKADSNSPSLTGTPTAPTASVDTNTTQVATTAFVVAQIADDAPTKTGSGASGTWGINISGNAATATNPTSGGTFITSSNIASQSVSFATSANSANSATTATNVTNGFGVGQEWSAPSRSTNVWYQNTTGKPIMVNIVFGSYGGGTLQVGVSTSSFSTANVTQNDIYQTNAMSAVVPNNYYYRCTGGGTWYELR